MENYQKVSIRLLLKNNDSDPFADDDSDFGFTPEICLFFLILSLEKERNFNFLFGIIIELYSQTNQIIFKKHFSSEAQLLNIVVCNQKFKITRKNYTLIFYFIYYWYT